MVAAGYVCVCVCRGVESRHIRWAESRGDGERNVEGSRWGEGVGAEFKRTGGGQGGVFGLAERE